MFLADDLHVYILVVVFVHCCHGPVVSEPEVDGVGGLLQGDAGPGDVGWDVGKEGGVFGAEVVVFWSRGGRVRGWVFGLDRGRVCLELTSLSVFDVPDLRWRRWWKGTVFLDVVHEVDEVFLRLVRFHEEQCAVFSLNYTVCVARSC